MKAGFFNPTTKSSEPTDPTVKVPTREELRGVKKGELKNMIIKLSGQLAESEERVRKEQKLLRQQKKKMEEAKKLMSEVIETSESLKEKVHRSIYISNLPHVIGVLLSAKSEGWTYRFGPEYIAVCFNGAKAAPIIHSTGAEIYYGVRFTDQKDGVFSVAPCFLKNLDMKPEVRCAHLSGEAHNLNVSGDELYATIVRFSLRKDEYVNNYGKKCSHGSAVDIIAELLRGLSQSQDSTSK